MTGNNRNKPLYDFAVRNKGLSTMISVVTQRAGISVQAAEKVIPPVVLYNIQGHIKSLTVEEIVGELKFHPYQARSKDFNAERLADTQVFSFYQQLEHFPTMPTISEGNKKIPHPVADFIYSTLVYLKPDDSLEALRKMGFYHYSQEFPKVIAKVLNNIQDSYNKKFDGFSVGKKDTGSYLYLADDDGISWVAKAFNFGLAKLIPTDRVAREVSSLKAAERFVNPIHGSYPLSEFLKPFVSTLRIAVVGTKVSMLDSGDLYPSGVPKVACKLESTKVIGDLTTIPLNKRNLELRPFRGGLEAVHIEKQIIDETKDLPGAIKLVLPGGVKFVAQPQEDQAFDSHGEPVDLLLDFRTLEAKGAAALFCFDEENTGPIPANLEELRHLFDSLPRRVINYRGEKYHGYILQCPVMRPGLRYTENAKPSNRISVDLISKAIMKWDYQVPKRIEGEYDQLKTLRRAIVDEISATVSSMKI